MPNWCSTTFKFYSDNTEQITDFYNRIIEFTSHESKTRNDFGKKWLGNIIEGFNLEKVENIRYRGWIDICDKTENSFSLYTETAWVPMTRMWNVIIEKYYPDIRYVFEAEECGNQLFVTSDADGEYFTNRYKLDCHIEKTDSYFEEYFETAEDVIEAVNRIFRFNGSEKLKAVEQIAELAKTFNSNVSSDDWLYVYEFEITSNYDWE